MLCLLLASFILQSLAQQCDPGWFQNEAFCYQYNKDSSQRASYDVLAGRCKIIGAEIASGETVSEFNYLDSLSRQDVQNIIRNGDFVPIYPNQVTECVLLGGMRNSSNVYQWITDKKTITTYPCCPGIGNDSPNSEPCVVIQSLQTKPSCTNDYACDRSFYRYFCKKKLCTVPNTEWRDGACRCDKDHVDSSQANRHRRGDPKPQLHCIPKAPCNNVTKSLSILFIIDSSLSIGERNWASLTEFLRLGSRLLPNKARIGFIKYASNVSYTKWIQAGWSAKEFKNRVPYKFDGGETNTAEALDTAVSMFKKDYSKYQAAVLITDGLPYTAEYAQKKEEALALTKQAANRLLRDVNLIALGYGRDLHKSNDERYLKQLVEEPKSDYFEFHDDACDLEESDMSILLDKGDYKKICIVRIVRDLSDQEYWTGVGTYLDKWLFHDQTVVDYFRLNPKHDFEQSSSLALAFTSKSRTHANLGYTKVFPAETLLPYICVRKPDHPYVTVPEPEGFPEETTTTSTTPTTTATVTPCEGTWSTWKPAAEQKGGFDICGAAMTTNYTRYCLDDPRTCPCTGDSWANIEENWNVCYYPRLSCVPPRKAAVIRSTFGCPPLTDLPADAPPAVCRHGVWSSWGAWSQCSATCGYCGTTSRTRTCLTASSCPCDEPNASSQTQGCGYTPCSTGQKCCGPVITGYDGAEYCGPRQTCSGTWSEWGPAITGVVDAQCTATCGNCGTKKETRYCYPSGCKCAGIRERTVPCSNNLRLGAKACCAPYVKKNDHDTNVCG